MPALFAGRSIKDRTLQFAELRGLFVVHGTAVAVGDVWGSQSSLECGILDEFECWEGAALGPSSGFPTEKIWSMTVRW
jgi:hypothetical protein